jgi:hypothetical protein
MFFQAHATMVPNPDCQKTGQGRRAIFLGDQVNIFVLIADEFPGGRVALRKNEVRRRYRRCNPPNNPVGRRAGAS